jgi:hypothetical protein
MAGPDPMGVADKVSAHFDVGLNSGVIYVACIIVGLCVAAVVGLAALWVSSISGRLKDAQEQLRQAGEDLRAVRGDVKTEQREHVETALDGLRIAGALEPLVADIRDELVRRGRTLRPGPQKGVTP